MGEGSNGDVYNNVLPQACTAPFVRGDAAYAQYKGVVTHIGDALLANMGHHFVHARRVAAMHLAHKIAEQRARIIQGPTAVHHREEHNRHLCHCRLPHLHQAPGPRQDALRCEDNNDIRLMNTCQGYPGKI